MLRSVGLRNITDLLLSWPMSETTNPRITPLLSKEKLERILSNRRSLTSSEAYLEVETHLGRRLSPARKPVLRNGRKLWVSC